MPWRHPLIGRRGRALAGFAVLDVVYGLRLTTVGPDGPTFYGWLATGAPLEAWAVPWWVVAVLCLMQAVRLGDRVAFQAAIAIKVFWAGLYLCAWVFGGVDDGWVSAAIWGTFAWVVWIIAGWAEALDHREPVWTP